MHPVCLSGIVVLTICTTSTACADLSSKYGTRYAIVEQDNLLWLDRQPIFEAGSLCMQTERTGFITWKMLAK